MRLEKETINDFMFSKVAANLATNTKSAGVILKQVATNAPKEI